MSITRNFNLYLTAGRTIPLVINANQYDQGEQWVFTLYNDDGTKYVPSTGGIVGIKSDNLGIINSGSVVDGNVVITETQQMTAAAGKAVFELILDNSTHGTANFILMVEPKPGDNADLSESDLSLLQEAIDATSPLPTGGTVGQVLTKTANGSTWSDAGTPTQEQIASAVSNWADEHITVSTGVVIDTSLSVAGAAADAKATGDAISDGFSTGILPTNKTFTWVNGWINTSGKIQASTASKSALVTLYAGEKITVGTRNSNICIIGTTQNNSIAINDTVTVIQRTTNADVFETYSYTATGTINIVFCVRYSEYSLQFTKPTNLATLYSSVGDASNLETSDKSNLVAAINEVYEMADDTKDYLEEIIIHDPKSNYINKEEYTNGYINSSGEFVSNADWRATGFCELSPNTHYYSDGLYGGYCAFYGADKTTVIASYGVDGLDVSSFTTPAGTVYGRFSLNTLSPVQGVEKSWIYTLNEKPKDYAYVLHGIGIEDNADENPCDYIGDEISVFNKILCVGDSMTEGTFNHLDSGSTQWVTYSRYAYPKYLQKMTGVETTNLGHGGQTSVQWYNTEKDNDLSGYDCAIVQLGINDFGTYGELGNDTETAFQNIINKLKTENNNIKIFVANIIPATSYSSAGYKQFSDDLLDWLETTYASDPNVIPVDIQQYGHTGSSSAYNCGHLSALGYRRLAEDYKNFISWYIRNNKDVFREVQFIGTNYWYINPNA